MGVGVAGAGLGVAVAVGGLVAVKTGAGGVETVGLGVETVGVGVETVGAGAGGGFDDAEPTSVVAVTVADGAARVLETEGRGAVVWVSGLAGCRAGL